MRMNDDVVKAGRISCRIDSSNVAINPRNYRSKSIVIVRVHCGIASVSVPTLPPRSCAFRKHITPGRIGVVQQQAICHVTTSMIGEREEQKWRAQKSGRKMPVTRFDVFDEIVDKCRLK